MELGLKRKKTLNDTLTEFGQNLITFQTKYFHFIKFLLKNVGNLKRAKSS